MTGPRQFTLRDDHAEQARNLIWLAYFASRGDELPIPQTQSQIDCMRRANEAAVRLVRLIDEIGTILNAASMHASDHSRVSRKAQYGADLPTTM